MIEIIEGRVIGSSGLDTLVNKIFNLDIFALCDLIPDGSVDFILCDLPYGTTACTWDEIIPFDLMWASFNRIIKPNGVIALTATDPFSTQLKISSSKYKYPLIWNKHFAGNFNLGKFQPMRIHEDILIFYEGKATYNPQMEKRNKPIKGGGFTSTKIIEQKTVKALKKDYDEKFPVSILDFPRDLGLTVHPTQKPIPLFEYLIKTYTNSGDLVFDPCVGSGTTAIAARNTGRRFIVGDSSLEYCQIAQDRLRLPFEASQIKKKADLSELPLFSSLNIDKNI